MNKAFNKFTWQNEPSVDTPLSAENLMKLNNALDTVDSRVVTMDTTKLDKTTANTMVKDISFDEATGIFTVTKLNGSTFQIDTKLEKIIVNFRFDKNAQKLVIILDDGTEQEVDLSALVTQYEFKESDTIILSVDADGKVYGTIKKGSITGEMLEPNYLANVTEKADTATTKAQEAENSAIAAKESETNAKASETTVKQAETNAINSANKAESYAVGGTGTRDGEDTDNAKFYSQNASSDAQSALSSANTATKKASEATASATKAKESENIAVESATSAENSANTATQKASEATASATASEASAVRAEEAAEKVESIVGFNIDDALSETSVNPVQNKVITKAVNDIVSGDKTVGNADTVDGYHAKSLINNHLLVGTNYKYRAFLKYEDGTSSMHPVSFLVSGVSNFGSQQTGVWLVEITYRTVGSPKITITQISPTGSNDPVTFGYYVIGNALYFGVYASTGYPDNLTITMLSNNVNRGLASWFSGSFDTYYNSDAVPTGWTEVAINRVLSTKTDLANYLPLSGGTAYDLKLAVQDDNIGEGGQLAIEKTSKSDLAGDILLDNQGNRIRFFEGGGSYRGANIDLTQCTSVDSNFILHTGNSYRIIKDTTAPSDTTCVWIDTATKTIKLYLDGAWTTVKEVEETGAGYHNSVHRGKYLGTSVTEAQWAAIKAGTFEDLYIGDYWIINGIVWRIAAFDYYLNCGDAICAVHHVVVVPDQALYNAQMNNTESGDYVDGDPANTTAGGYVGSDMRTQNLEKAKTIISEAFGEEHILKHRRLLSNAVTNGYTSGHAWYDSTVELMTERNVYGNSVFSNFLNGTNHSYNYTIDKTQFPLFAFRPDLITSTRAWYWLMDVATSSDFAYVPGNGAAHCYPASYAGGVRPDFSIYQA